MKLILAPSILSADFGHLGRDIDIVTEAGAEYIHFDVMDGMFVPNISVGLPVLASVRKGTQAVLDVHLMVTKPERYVQEFVKKGADIVTIHYEATDDVAENIRLIKEAGAKVGISIKPATPAEVLFPYLKDIDMALVMSVEPGFGGQAFIPESYDKIRALRSEADRLGIQLDIEVDGGVGTGNIKKLADAGVNVFVAGSSVYKGDAAGNTKELLAIAKGEKEEH